MGIEIVFDIVGDKIDDENTCVDIDEFIALQVQDLLPSRA